MTRHTDQPGRDPAPRRVVALGLIPAAKEGVLDHFLRKLPVAHHPDREGVEKRSVALVKRAERGLVALLEAPELRLVGGVRSGGHGV